jgi:PilZ domain
MAPGNVVDEKAIGQETIAERRRSRRLSLQVPLFVRSRDLQGEQFLELAKTINISDLGALVVCPRAPQVGELVTLTIPAPSITSSALVPSTMAPIQAKVKRRQDAGDVYLIGVEFSKPLQ